uniref:GTP-binding protein Rheb-like n=1 Tax=Sinocyclocheilus anshuiensis TaxID=1608454 RepID=A0A671NAH5_9TELE
MTPPPRFCKTAVLHYNNISKFFRFLIWCLLFLFSAFTKMITVNGQEYHLQLVDTAGQDEYSIFPQTYSIDINGYILVYSVTSNKRIWFMNKTLVPIMLVGNKKDLHMERVISCEEGKALAESWNAAFMESSAKENQVMMRFLLTSQELLYSLLKPTV